MWTPRLRLALTHTVLLLLALTGCVAPTIYEVQPGDALYNGPAPITEAAPAEVAAPNSPLLLNCDTLSPAALSTGHTCTLTAAVPADPAGRTVSYVNGGSTCPGASVNASTGNVTFSAPAKNTSCVLSVKASNGILFSPVVSSEIITAGNNPPAFPSAITCPATPIALSTGVACTLTPASPLDLDGDPIVYMDGGSTCASVSLNGTTGAITFTAPAKGATCVVKVRAYDGTQFSSAVSSNVITGADNPPYAPASLSCPTTPVAASTNNACTLTAASPADPDGDSVTYSDGGSTCSATVVNATTGNATFTAPARGATCVVKVRAHDGGSFSSAVSSATITGQNRSPNTPSALTCATTPLGGATDQVCTLTAASPADPDGDAVTYSNDGSTCMAVVVNVTTGTVTFTAPGKGATCLVKVRAHDGLAYSSAVSSATITGQNNSPATPTSLSCITNPLGGATGQTCTLTAASPADPDGDPVSYSNGGGTCSGVIVNSTTGNLTFTAPAKNGSCVVKVRASDGTAFSSPVSSATITGQNNAPMQPASLSCPANPAAGSAGNACTLTAAIPADPDGDPVTYSDDGSDCAATTVDSSTGAVTFTAPASGASCSIKVKSYDGTAYSTAVTVNIGGSNNPPNTPTALSCMTTPLGGSTGNACTLTAASPADPDGDPVSYSNDGSTCTGVVVNGTTGATTFTAPAKNATCVVRIRASDGSAYSSGLSSATITGQNNAPNTPSTLSCATSPAGGSTGNTCTLTAASPADPDGDPVSYSNNGSTCSAVVVNATTGNATFTAPAWGSTCVVKVQASDGAASSGTVTSATITGQNNAPNTPSAVNCSTTPVASSTGNTCTLTAASPADPDGQTVTFFDDGSTCAATVVNATTGNTTFTAPVKGATCVIKVKAYDGLIFSNAVSSATITGQNRAPNTPSALTCPTTPLASSTGNACTLTAASPTDPDGDAVVYSDDASTCAAVTVNSTTGNATFTAPASGATCVVKVKAYDGTNYSSAVSSATITGQNQAPNTPAALTCPTTPLAGSAANACTLTAASPADPDGQTVTYSNDGSTCSAVSVNATTGNATFTAPAKGASCVVKVRSHDGTAYSSAISSATITGQNNPPTIPTGLSCPTTPLGGATGLTCTLTAASPADLDGDAVTYSDNVSTCASVVVNSSTGNVTFTAPNKGATCLVKVIASDGTAFSSSRSSGSIAGQNNPPNTPAGLTCPTSPSAGSTGNSCTLSAASPVDRDGDAVTYSDGGSTCASPSVSANGATITFTAPAAGATCVMKVKANDGLVDSGIVSSTTITGASGAATVNLTIAADTNNYDIFVAAGSPTSATAVTLTVNAGVKIGDNARLGWAMRTGTFPAGSTITIINNGSIIGHGGNGGNGGTSGNPMACTAGENGGNGLYLSWPVTLQGNGTIAGGGGGGSGSQYAVGTDQTGSGGGGGGAGLPAGIGGSGTTSGYSGSLSWGGSGGVGSISYEIFEAQGGDGGVRGAPGGTSGSCSLGGTAGHAIINNGNPVNQVAPKAVTQISSGYESTCAVVNGGVKCTGRGNSGVVGDSTAADRDGFVQTIAENSGATHVQVGTYHACALVNNGIQCWGYNNYGQVGDGTNTQQNSPVQIIASGATALSTTAYTSCAVMNGGVKCWGAGNDGALGNGSMINSNIPVQTIASSSGATAISVGSYYACAVVNGGVKCWGSNASGQLGDGTTTNQSTPVQTIPADSGVTAIAAGGSHTCAVIAGGVRCWGVNSAGQLGNGTTINSATPVQAIASGSGVTSISAGGAHSCALFVNGAVRCWGSNSYGQLGDGSTTVRNAPVEIIAAGASAAEASYGTTCAVIDSHPYCWGNNNYLYGSFGMGSMYVPKPTLSGLFGSILGPVSF